jgi:putative oxidoreductase
MNCQLAQKTAAILGRICIALLFFQSGWHKIGAGFEPNLKVMVAKGLPMPEVLLAMTIAMVFAGGAMILLGWYARTAALVLAIWMVPITIYYHAFWDADPAQLFNQTTHFMKNLAITGALLHLFAVGPGPCSLHDDNCRKDGVAA